MFVRPSLVASAVFFALVLDQDGGLVGQDETTEKVSAAASCAAPLPSIVPPIVPNGWQEIPLPETVDGIDVGGGGRYLVLYFRALRKIGIFDVNQMRIVGYVPAPDENTRFAAGARKMVVVSGISGVVARWDLATQERELTQTIELGGPAWQVLLGAASAGPAIVSAAPKGRRQRAWLVDVNTLRVTQFTVANSRLGFGAGGTARIASNGNVLGLWSNSSYPSGLQLFVKSGDKWRGYQQNGDVGAIFPSPDGKLLYTKVGIYTNQLHHVLERSAIPAVHGPYCIGQSAEHLYLRFEGDDRLLGTVPNPDVYETPTDNRRRSKAFWLDKSLFLIPDAKIIVQLSATRKKLFVLSFDLERALELSQINYLFVSSFPPRCVKAGEHFEYQMAVKSKQDGVEYSLDSGPPGMMISPTGLLSWKTTLDSPPETNVIVSVADASQRQIFHTFELEVIGGNSTADKVTAAAAHVGSPVPPIVTTPANLPAETIEVELPSTARDVSAGGNGRLILFHLPDLKKIAILDVSQGKITGYIPASDGDAKMVAGATRALVFSPTRRVVSRYRLDTFAHEVTVAYPFSDPIQFAGMGAGSEGPAMLRTSKGIEENDPVSFHFFDVDAMKPMAVSWRRGPPREIHDDEHHIYASTSGNVFSVSRVGLVRLNGTSVQWKVHGGLPSAEGHFFLAGGRLRNSDLQLMGDDRTSYGFALPSVTGSYFISLRQIDVGRLDPSRITIYMFGEDQPLATIEKPDLAEELRSYQRTLLVPVKRHLDLSAQQHSYHGSDLTPLKRLFFVPDAHIIATLLASNDRVELRRFNVEHALQRSGLDYLVVESQAPRHAEVGRLFAYAMQVKSKRGGVKFSLDAGPAGMKVSQEGRITWTPPPDIGQQNHKVIVSVSNPGGQLTFHTFSVDVRAATKASAAAQQQRKGQSRTAPAQAQDELVERQEDHTEAAQNAAAQNAAAQNAAAQNAAAQNAAANAIASRASMRSWEDRTGNYKVVGRFVQIVDKKTLVLELESGKKSTIPLSRLSRADLYEAVKSDLIRQGAVLNDVGASPFELEK